MSHYCEIFPGYVCLLENITKSSPFCTTTGIVAHVMLAICSCKQFRRGYPMCVLRWILATFVIKVLNHL